LLSESAARVFAVERDTRCLAVLAEISAAAPGRLAVENADALELDEAALFAAHGIDTPIAVVANLPFNVGTALLVKWLTVAIWPPWWARLTLMFQAEVAARITAEAGDEDYGRLAVLAQWRCTARKLFDVSRRVFVPIPNVDAAIVRIDPLPAPRFPAALRDLEAVTAAAFGQRRKMLRQSLKSISPDVNELLGLAGIDGAARPETLSIEQFCALARARAAILAGSIRPSVS
jgi:16S rRNA (adenine1518-N6/adenine1519-N6)-dimethyltransferase